MKKYNQLATLRKLIKGMEQDLGLADLPALERDMVIAADELSDSQSNFDATALLAHDLLTHIPRATFQRALQSLVKKQYFTLQPGSKSSHYQIVR